jgi:ribosomal protein S18 acetylase RimI-like enzyme
VTIAAAAAIAARTDLSPTGIRTAIHEDLAASVLRRRTIAGERVIRTPELLAYASDARSPDVNEVVAARFGPGAAADAAIDATIELFAGRPFLWWVGEDDTPADLGERLSRRGVIFLDDLPGMAMDLADLADATPAPPELTIRPVLDATAMADFQGVLLQGFPEDVVGDGVEAEIAAASVRVAAESGYREPNGIPTRWLGTVDGRPVATTRLHTGAGVAGIYTVITATDARRRGYGEALTRHALHVAREGGLRIATLQASTAGRGVYERIGFRERCRFRLHEWRPAPNR